MAEANIVSEAGGDAAEGRTANLIYILYLLSLIFGVTSLVGLIMAYINKGDAPEWVQSHYRFQIRTFWIGLLLGVIGFFTAAFVVGILILVFLFVWWIARCVKGMKYISEGSAHPDPASWMFG
ncbi:MAG: hypothetical protein IH786_01085 [Proteobacteria bacterium]|nr:hypothetical protein [Pseudomonadota bacterium]